MSDVVNHPSHYTGGAIECIDAIEAMVVDMPPATAVRLANVLKYIWRHHKKGGVESLKKAAWYLRREIMAQERAKPNTIGNIIGKWPGDETDEEIEAALKELS